jgi:hypothetical protein
MSNTRLWDKLGKTDPANTKGFKRAGGFSGTAIKPMWSFKRMTEEFGPCGIGWGVNEPSFQVVNGCEGEVLVYCTVSVWYTEPATEGVFGPSASKNVFGVGGDKVVVKQSSGLRSDDEAFKKAYTDAIGNALKLIGVGADVHMGLFDDSKYVNEMRQEFAEEAPPKPSSKPVEAPKTFNSYLTSITSAKDVKALGEAWAEINQNKAAMRHEDVTALTEAKDAKKNELLKTPTFEHL